MPGTANEEHKPGDGCWIEVDSANSPEGLWLGEVVSCEQEGDYWRVQAKITDPRLSTEYKTDAEYLGRSPGVNYTVFPRGKHLDRLAERVKRLEKERAAREHDSAIRYNTLLSALMEVCKGNMTKEETIAAIERGASRS